MAKNCPLGFGQEVSCERDCTEWHKGFGYCMQKYNNWQESFEAKIGSAQHLNSNSPQTPLIPPLPTPLTPPHPTHRVNTIEKDNLSYLVKRADRLQAELNHLTNKINEHLDKSKKKSKKGSAF